MEIFILRAIGIDLDCKETVFTDGEHIEKCVEALKNNHYDLKGVSVNKAVMCFDGYFVNGDFLGYK